MQVPVPSYFTHASNCAQLFHTRKHLCPVISHTQVPVPSYFTHASTCAQLFHTRKYLCPVISHMQVSVPSYFTHADYIVLPLNDACQFDSWHSGTVAVMVVPKEVLVLAGSDSKACCLR
jgi:hypothetical protein